MWVTSGGDNGADRHIWFVDLRLSEEPGAG